MSPLVSKWNTKADNTAEQEKDSKIPREKTLSRRELKKDDELTSASESGKKSKPLVSKWASANTEEVGKVVDTTKKKETKDFESRRRSGFESKPNRKQNSQSNRKYGRNNALMTPPSSSDALYGKEGVHLRKEDSGNLKMSFKNQGFNKSECPEKPVGTPMTENAASLAARIGAVSNNSKEGSRKLTEPKRRPRKIHERRYQDHEDYKDGNIESQEELPPMSEEARSFASRLGLVSSQEGNTKGDPSDASVEHKLVSEEKNAGDKKDTSNDKVDENLKEEVRQMFNKFTDSSTSWADLEDE